MSTLQALEAGPCTAGTDVPRRVHASLRRRRLGRAMMERYRGAKAAQSDKRISPALCPGIERPVRTRLAHRPCEGHRPAGVAAGCAPDLWLSPARTSGGLRLGLAAPAEGRVADPHPVQDYRHAARQGYDRPLGAATTRPPERGSAAIPIRRRTRTAFTGGKAARSRAPTHPGLLCRGRREFRRIIRSHSVSSSARSGIRIRVPPAGTRTYRWC